MSKTEQTLGDRTGYITIQPALSPGRGHHRKLWRCEMALTGRFDFRKTLSGRLVLLLEEDVAVSFSRLRKRSTRRRWRRARVIDLAAAEMRHLMDLRLKPNYQAPVRSFVELPLASHLPSADQAVSMVQSPHPEEANGEARVATH
jgi:hypothetical protein